MIGTLRVVGACLAIGGVVVISGCGDDSDDPDDVGDNPTVGDSSDSPTLDGHTFVASEVDGQTLVPETELTITFEDGRLAVIAGCNTMVGAYSMSGDVLVVDALAQTLMACEPERQTQDEWVSALVSGGPTLTRAAGTLTLASDDVTVTFDEQSDPPADPLDGSAWRVVSLDGSDFSFAVPEGAYLAYADGRVAVSTGCNSGSAEVEITEDTITFGPMALTRMACVGDVMAFETALVQLFGGPLEYTLESDELTLSNGESTLTLQRIP
jgi:heat shock protein HslJ